MAEKTEKKASIIRVSEVSLENMTNAASGNAVGQRKVKKSGATCWAQTALWLNLQNPLESFDRSLDIKDIAENVREAFKEAFIAEADIPEVGRNARTGKTMDVCDKEGIPKWSSWEETRAPISYCGDIATIIKANLVTDFIVSEKSVMAKADILAMAKVAEPAFETIKRSITLISAKVPAVNSADLITTIELLESLLGEVKTTKFNLDSAISE